MSDFLLYLEIGFRHILDLKAYDHILFLVAMTVPYAFKDWKKVLLLVTIFTIGHTLALFLALFGVVMIKSYLVEFLIPITILATAVYDLFTSGKSAKGANINIIGFITLFFGVVHGLGFSDYFKSLISGSPTDKLLPAMEFALGIELGQIAVVLIMLILSYIVQHFFRLSKRDFTLVVSSFVIGVILPLIMGNEIWYK